MTRDIVVWTVVVLFFAAGIYSIAEWAAACNHHPEGYRMCMPWPFPVVGTFVFPVIAMAALIIGYSDPRKK